MQLAFDFTSPPPPPVITRIRPAGALSAPRPLLLPTTPATRDYRRSHRPDILPGGHGYPAELDTAILRWADAHPVVWHIVTQRKSQVYGLGSSEPLGWAQREESPEAMLERIYTMYQVALAPHCYPDLWRWRLDFILTHYTQPGFTGATFRTTDDEQTARGILTMVYPSHLNRGGSPLRGLGLSRRVCYRYAQENRNRPLVLERPAALILSL